MLRISRIARTLLLLIALAAPQIGGAQPMLLKEKAAERLVQQGRRQLLRLRLEEAEETFRQLARRPQGAPAAYHHLATIALFKALMTDDEAHFEAFFERADRLLEALDDRSASSWRAYLEAEAQLQRVLAYVKTERYLRAAWAARSAYGAYEEALEDTSAFYEPYKGRGLFNLALGSLPSGYRRLLGVIGYEGDVEKGLRQLEVAAERSRFNREEAQVYRAVAGVALGKGREKSLKMAAALHRAHPESPLCGYFHGYVLLANRRAPAAAGTLRAAMRRMQQPGIFYIDYVDYFLGKALFTQNQFAEAEQHLRRYLARHQGAALKATAHLRLGLALEMQGEREEALVFYNRVESARGYDSDEAALRVARERIARPMTALERQLLRGRNQADAGTYGAAARTLRAVFKTPRAPQELRNEAAYRLGRVFHWQERYEEALRLYRYAAQHRAEERAKWGPWSQYYIGAVYQEQGRRARAEEAFRAALAYEPPFDYHRNLEQQAEFALEQMAP